MAIIGAFVDLINWHFPQETEKADYMFEINLFLLHFVLVQPCLLHGFNLPLKPIHVLRLI